MAAVLLWRARPQIATAEHAPWPDSFAAPAEVHRERCEDFPMIPAGQIAAEVAADVRRLTRAKRCRTCGYLAAKCGGHKRGAR